MAGRAPSGGAAPDGRTGKFASSRRAHSTPIPARRPRCVCACLEYPRPAQAYYRRGDACFALGKFKEALKDLRTVRICWRACVGVCVCACACACACACVCVRGVCVCVYVCERESDRVCVWRSAREFGTCARRATGVWPTMAVGRLQPRPQQPDGLPSPTAPPCAPHHTIITQAAKRAPRDPDLRRKLAECEKAVKRLRFEEALATPVGEGAAGSVKAGEWAGVRAERRSH